MKLNNTVVTITDEMRELEAQAEADHAQVVNEVASWLLSYNGTFEFLVSVRDQLKRGREMSEAQFNGVKKCMDRELRFTIPTGGLVKVDELPEGYFAIDVKAGVQPVVFLSITRAGTGKVHVCQFVSDSPEYRGTFQLDGQYRGACKEEVLARVKG